MNGRAIMKMRIELQIIMLVAAFALPIHAAKDEPRHTAGSREN